MLLILDSWSIIFLILMMVIVFKSLIGFHFPWEKCDCCGKKYREHVYNILIEHKKIGPPLSKPECRPFKGDNSRSGWLMHPPSTKKKNRMEGCV